MSTLSNGRLKNGPVGWCRYPSAMPVLTGARDTTTPFRFVESLYSLGQWISPHRLTRLEQLLWHSTAEADAGIYRCMNHYADFIDINPETQTATLQGV
jgi:hypothetical protein